MVETRYYYDAVGRLETAELPDGTTQHFIYDARGNRIEMAELRDGCIRVTTYVYDLNNRLLYSESDTESCYYEYDACGNQILRIVSSEGAARETKFVWNGAGQLAYSVDENGVASSYAYGPDGLRTSKTVGGEETRYFYEGGNILLELDSGSRITAKTIRGLRLISRETQTEEYGYLLDGHGDVAALVNPAGGILLDYDYDPFGNETTYQPGETAQLNNPFRYCGEYWDEETRTYYLRARQYDPTTGRFLSEDPIWFVVENLSNGQELIYSQSWNRYAYCYDNPVSYQDSSGQVAVTIGGAALGSGLAGVLNGVVVAVSSHPLVILAVAGTIVLAPEVQSWINSYEIDAERTQAWVRTQIETKAVDDKNLRDNTVYVIEDRDHQKVVYVGRTRNYTKRQYNHQRKPEAKYPMETYSMIPVQTGLTYRESRAVEQSLIFAYTLDALKNAINSIAENKLAEFEYEMDRAEQLMSGSFDLPYG